MNPDSAPPEPIAESRYLDGLEQMRAISSRPRRRILQLLVEDALTVTQLGKRLEMPPPTVQHHVRELLRVGLVRLVETRERRGILEKYYRSTARHFLLPKDPLAGQSPTDRLATVQELLDDVSHHVSAVLSSYSGHTAESEAVQLAVRVLALSPDELPEIATGIETVLEPYATPRHGPGEREYIVVHLAVPTHPKNPEGVE